ncbi:MAG: choice-of-anchor Q domain-containing protein, partial [Anaerolineales bacterium]
PLCEPGDCSLREAVYTANACEGVQEIHLENETYELTRMDPGDYEDPNAAGGLVLTESATIVGNGGIVDGQDRDRLFEVQAGEDGRVVFEDILLRKGRHEDQGGALYIRSGGVELERVAVRENNAGDGEERDGGGGIFLGEETELTLVNSDLSFNRTQGDGGAIFAAERSTLSVDSDSILRGNEVAGGFSGGAIHSRGEARIAGTIAANQSAGDGGGINNGGVMEIRGAQLTGNSAVAAGGAIHNSGELIVVESLLDENEAAQGAALASRNEPPFAVAPSVELTDTRLVENAATQIGGGILNGPDSGLTATGLTLFRNEAERGGGLFNEGTVEVSQTSFDSNIARGVEGGGLWTAGPVSLNASTLGGNQSEGTSGAIVGGSAAWIDEGGRFTMLNVTIGENEQVTGDGAAVFNLGGVIEGDYVTAADNFPYAFSGRAEALADTRLSHSIVVENGEEGCSRGVTSEGFNLFDSALCGADPSLNDILLTAEEDAGVIPLGDHGGPTRTIALISGSPAMDAIPEGCPPPEVDQRGITRPDSESGQCDIGAYEAIGEARDAGADGGTPRAGEIDVNFNADLYTIEEGQCTTLRWQVTGANSILLLGQEREATAAQEVCPDETTGYTLFAENESDEAQSFLEIEVTEPMDDRDLSCLHRRENENQAMCYEVCPVDDPQPGGTCTP